MHTTRVKKAFRALFDVAAIAGLLPRKRGDDGDGAGLEGQRPGTAEQVPPEASSRENPQWRAHAYPLKQVTIKLQGSRRSREDLILAQLLEVVDLIDEGYVSGAEHDDGFGYAFEVDLESERPSFFEGGGRWRSKPGGERQTH